MIISPPFLPSRGANDTDEQWLAVAMLPDVPAQGIPSGVFPVSRDMGWHGGVHLVAPQDPPQTGPRLPVRAIADGQVVYARQPSAVTTDPADPLNYGPSGLGPSRTDDGCVVVVHETEIGADANGAATPVRFYSIYMHLSAVPCAQQTVNGQMQLRQTPFPILRKDEIGTAGRIYGQPDRIHFEIVFDDVTLPFVLGRALNASPGRDAQGRARSCTLDLAATASGRIDAVFGEVLFRIPQATNFYATQPAANETAPTAASTTPLQAGMIVGMRFAAGDGPQAHRGDITWTSTALDGTAIGAPIVEAQGEYNLYASANAVVQAYAQASQPAPNASAVFELLRFGRIVDTAHETLAPADVPLWRQVNHPGGQGWVNLRGTGVQVYSDSDLPQWKGWAIVDADTDGDSRCDASEIRSILDQNGDGTVTPAEANARLGDAAVRDKLAKLICKMPTEWDPNAIDAHWGWLKQSTTENPQPLSEADFAKFRDHVQALCFWDTQAFGIATDHWHMHPREFIQHFRKCGWMSVEEVIATFPRYHFYEENQAHQYVAHTQGNVGLYQISRSQAQTRISNYRVSLCRVLRKYGFSGWKRTVHLLCQLMLETDRWRTMKEYGKGKVNPNIPKAQYYAAFYGRGAIQTTWAGNYELYGIFRGIPDMTAAAYGDSFGRITQTSTHYWADPVNKQGQVVGVPKVWYPRFDPEMIADNDYAACDSAGFYYVSRNIGGHPNCLRKCDEDFVPATVGDINVFVNGGGNGYHERQAFAFFIMKILDDQFSSAATETITTARKVVIVNLERGI